jgi:hypothetical protein
VGSMVFLLHHLHQLVIQWQWGRGRPCLHTNYNIYQKSSPSEWKRSWGFPRKEGMAEGDSRETSCQMRQLWCAQACVHLYFILACTHGWLTSPLWASVSLSTKQSCREVKLPSVSKHLAVVTAQKMFISKFHQFGVVWANATKTWQFAFLRDGLNTHSFLKHERWLNLNENSHISTG